MDTSKSSSRTALVWIWISLLVIGLDQYSKDWISHQFQLHDTYDITSFLRLYLAHNKGAAFSMLAEYPKLALYVFSSFSALVVMGLVFWLFTLQSSSRWVAVSISLILGGAIGNLIDRIRYGYVIDFIDVYVNEWHWPIFNIADTAVCIGAVMLVIDIIWISRNRVK